LCFTSSFARSHVISSPRDPIARTRQAYHDHWETFLHAWGRGPYRRPPLLADMLRRVPRKAHLLDLGCGAGQDLREIRRAGFRVIGLDLNRSLLHYARRRSPRLTLVQADIRHLPYAAGAFDGVWAAASLIHLPKISVQASLRCLATLTRPGGLFAATFIHGRRSGILQSGWIPGRFISRWHKQELATALDRAGWDIVQLKTVSDQERKGRWLNLIASRPA
jgi:SAM-dependent methyltransferase